MAPLVWKTVAESQGNCATIRKSGKTIGVVPTMGALHAGHLSLAVGSQAACDVTVVTIFVNPTQFGPDEDLSRYPRTFEEDMDKLAAMGVDAVFAPGVEEMYPAGATTSIDPPTIAQPLEGVCRPGHFRGVATIVLKLFLAVPADRAFFGQKDFQQSLVIQHMVKELNHPIAIDVLPIVREPDGLAMSSRNRHLSPAERERALALRRTLRNAKKWIEEGEQSYEDISRRMQEELEEHVDKIDYALVADATSLAPLVPNPTSTAGLSAAGPSAAGLSAENGNSSSAVALIAAYVGATRLIDNEIIDLGN